MRVGREDAAHEGAEPIRADDEVRGEGLARGGGERACERVERGERYAAEHARGGAGAGGVGGEAVELRLEARAAGEDGGHAELRSGVEWGGARDAAVFAAVPELVGAINQLARGARDRDARG